MAVPGQNGSRRLHQQLTSKLLSDVAGGRYSAGERLPTEMTLAKELGVSRGVVRELLRRLEDRGVVSIQHGRGARVEPQSAWNVLDAEILSALLPTPASISLLADYLECRKMLETEAAALAAERASSHELTKLADAYNRMSDRAHHAASNPGPEAEQAFHEADIEFHGVIFDASGNQVLPRVVEPIQRAMSTIRPRLALHPEDRFRTTLPEHKAILGSIADHDPAAARDAMATHLGTVEGYLREYRRRSSSSEHQRSGRN